MMIEHIAWVCHEANRALQLTLGEEQNPPWNEVSMDMRESVHRGVHAALDDADPKELHEKWMQDRLDHGWVYGEVKDFVAKTHPNLVPYDELPEEQRAKDRLFHAIVKALA